MTVSKKIRTKRFNMDVSVQELKLIAAAARYKGLSMAGYVRLTVLEAADKLFKGKSA